MFRQTVDKTPFTDSIADEYFRNRISGSSAGGDRSFMATLRALFAERMPDDDVISFIFNTSSHRPSSFDGANFNEIVAIPAWSTGTVLLHAFCGSVEGNDRAMNEAQKHFDGLESDGWKRLTRPTEYYAKTMRVLVYVRASGKNVAVFTDSADLRKIHFLEAGMLSFFPWYFDPSNGFSAEEKALCESLMKSSPDAYYAALDAIAEKIGFRSDIERKMLNEFEAKGDRDRVNKEGREIIGLNDQIEELNGRISSILRERYERQIVVLGLLQKIESGQGTGELGDYFASNKNVSFAGISDEGISFIAKGYLSYWDEEVAERVIGKSSSYLYGGCGSNKEDFSLLYRAVFIDRTIRIRVCAAFRINRNSSVYRYTQYQFPPECGTYIPNPHIDRYACVGDNERVINDLISKSDYIGAVEQCVASTLNFNLLDSTVMNAFGNALNKKGDYTPNVKAFELPDGTVTDPKGAIEWLKSQNTEVNA